MDFGIELFKWLEERNLLYPLLPFILILLVLVIYVMVKDEKSKQRESLCISCKYKRTKDKYIQACDFYENRHTYHLEQLDYCNKEIVEGQLKEMMKNERKDNIVYFIIGVCFFVLIMFVLLTYDGTDINSQKEEDGLLCNKEMKYSSSVSINNCYLCGNNSKSMLFSHWGKQNIILIDLKTFECFVFDLNRYDDINLITENVRVSNKTGCHQWRGIGGSTVDFSLI